MSSRKTLTWTGRGFFFLFLFFATVSVRLADVGAGDQNKLEAFRCLLFCLWCESNEREKRKTRAGAAAPACEANEPTWSNMRGLPCLPSSACIVSPKSKNLKVARKHQRSLLPSSLVRLPSSQRRHSSGYIFINARKCLSKHLEMKWRGEKKSILFRLQLQMAGENEEREKCKLTTFVGYRKRPLQCASMLFVDTKQSDSNYL